MMRDFSNIFDILDVSLMPLNGPGERKRCDKQSTENKKCSCVLGLQI
jgi:hypothetical protein